MSHPYKEGPHVRANGGAKEVALVDKDEDPRVSQHAKDRIKRLIGGAGRPLRLVAPGRDPVQVHFGEECDTSGVCALKYRSPHPNKI